MGSGSAPRLRIWIAGGALAGAAAALLAAKGHLFNGKPTSSVAPAATARALVPLEVEQEVFDGGPKPGWSAEGWGAREITPGAPARIGFASFGAFVLRHEELSERYGAVSFRMKAPPGFGEFLRVSLRAASADETKLPPVTVTALDIAPLPDGWGEVLIPFRSLNPDGLAFDRIVLEAFRMVPADWVLIDRVVLTKPSAPSRARPVKADKKSRVSIDCKASALPINPLIYGIARGAVASGESAHRIGGNAMTRLNWDQGNLWNTGSDWFFENTRGEGKGLSDWLEKAQAQGLQMALTVPTIGWVAKDATSVGFPVSELGPQRKHDPNRPNAGDGYSTSDKPLEPRPPTQTSEAAPPERIGRWIRELVAKDKQSGKRSAAMYFLDNEPDLWHQTHRDVHPAPLSYDELLDFTLRYGSAIREADPQAVIAGPSSWGWSGYSFSAKDQVAGFRLQPDRRAHEGKPLLAWYLQKLHEHEQRTGVRVLDVLDVHYYPQAQGIYGGDPSTDEATAALRLRSTRSLWDPSYRDESWINENVRLLPRLREWVDQNYPGRGISLGEWSFGAEKHVSGALATAEALGRFGQAGLTAAFYWADPGPSTATFWAFRAYRNYDGKGARFLDFSVKAQASAPISVFASRDADSSRIVVITLNLDPQTSVELNLDTTSCGDFVQTRGFDYSATSDGIVADAAPQASGQFVQAPYTIRISELERRRQAP